MAFLAAMLCTSIFPIAMTQLCYSYPLKQREVRKDAKNASKWQSVSMKMYYAFRVQVEPRLKTEELSFDRQAIPW
jgi:hypothetical protein